MFIAVYDPKQRSILEIQTHDQLDSGMVQARMNDPNCKVEDVKPEMLVKEYEITKETNVVTPKFIST